MEDLIGAEGATIEEADQFALKDVQLRTEVPQRVLEALR